MSYRTPEVYAPPEAAAMICADCHARYHAPACQCPDPSDCPEDCPCAPCHDAPAPSPCDCTPEAYARRGETCDTCGCWYNGEDWTDAPPESCRWATCTRCNAQVPYSRSDTDARRAALRGRLACDTCGQPSMHF